MDSLNDPICYQKLNIFPLTYKKIFKYKILDMFNFCRLYELDLNYDTKNIINRILEYFPNKEEDIFNKLFECNFINSKRLIFRKEEDCEKFIKYINAMRFLDKVGEY